MPDNESISDLSDVVEAINKLCDTMKTSSYDEYEEEVDNEEDAKYYIETQVVEREEAPVEYYGYEAPIFEMCKAPVVESYEEQVGQNYEEQADQTYEAPVAQSYDETTDRNNELQNATTHETPTFEKCKPQVTIIAPQSDNYTPSEPPPVPKRTLLPSNTTTEVKVVPVTSKIDTPEVTEEPAKQNVAFREKEVVSPEDVVQKTDSGAERWSDSTSVSLPGQVEDVETVYSDPGNAQCDAMSEMYYTASSEVSLLSDTEIVDKVVVVADEDDEQSKDDRKNVIAGHVAAMRERFESMTRTNTPCPDLIRSLSPSLEVFRTTSPSPDRLA